MNQEQWGAIRTEGEEINLGPADTERYTGLAEMYVQDERFAAHYNACAPGLAEFLADAMKHFADGNLS